MFQIWVFTALYINLDLSSMLLCSNFLFIKIEKGLGKRRGRRKEGGLVGDNGACGGSGW